MAYLQESSQSTPTSIDRFYGLNLSQTGDTNLALGESGKMKNFIITKDYKLRKMYGYREQYITNSNSKVRAQWIGKLGNQDVHIYVIAGKIYNKGTEIGDITDDITSIFEFNKKLYFLNGHEYLKWDGEQLEEVEGDIPLVKISTTPGGVGTDYEPINMLTGKKHQTFSPDGEATEFFIAEQNIDSIDKVIINGTEQSDNYTVDLLQGKVTFNTAPIQAVDNIDIYWTKGTGNREYVYKNKYYQKYGLANDTRVFLYGNEDAKNRCYYSDLVNGIPSVEYFPGTNFNDVGSSNTSITDIKRQYDRLVIYKLEETYYTTYESITDPTGNNIITFPIYPLNSAHGMVAYSQGQVLNNNIVTIDTSIVEWVSTATKDEKNAQIISQRIEEWLNQKDLSKSITMDYQEFKEYWLAIENEIMIYNYANSTFYLLEIPDKVSSLINYEGKIYMGTENGKIMIFDEEETTYNGEIIKGEWQMGYYDFGMEERRKTMRILWLVLKPHSKTSLVINYISDRDTGIDEKEIQSRCIDYNYWNYADFTYNTQRSVKPFRVKLKAKKFAFLKLVLRNEKKDEKVIINSIAIKKAFGGEVK